MTQIKVNTSGISGLERKMGDVVRQCSDCESVVSRVRLGLDWDIKVKDNIGNHLSRVERNLQEQEEIARELKKCLGDVREGFTRKDRQLEKEMKALLLELGIDGNVLDSSPHTGNNHNDKNSWLKKLLEFLDGGNWNILERIATVFGGLGAGVLIDRIGDFFSDLFNKKYAGLASTVISGADTVAGIADDVMDLTKTGGKAASKGAGVAGPIITLITSGLDNYQEYKDGEISGERAFRETITESAVDIALGVGLTAVCTAVAGPAGPLIASAIQIGLDFAVENITGEGISEWVSDGLFWLEEKCIGGLKNIGKGAAKAAWKAIFT